MIPDSLDLNSIDISKDCLQMFSIGGYCVISTGKSINKLKHHYFTVKNGEYIPFDISKSPKEDVNKIIILLHVIYEAPAQTVCDILGLSHQKVHAVIRSIKIKG